MEIEFGNGELAIFDIAHADRRRVTGEGAALALEQRQAAPEHQFGQLRRGQAADIFGAAGEHAVAQHRTGIADFEDLVIVMRDEDEGDALRLELAHEGEELDAVFHRQSRRRLVEDDDLAAAEHGAQDVELAPRHRVEAPGKRLRVDAACLPACARRRP